MDKAGGCVPVTRRLSTAVGRAMQRTEWTRGEADYILRRLDNVLGQLPAARRQARQRILQGQLVPSKDRSLVYMIRTCR